MLPAQAFKTEGLGENTKPAGSEAALGRAAFLLLAGEEALEVFGSFLYLRRLPLPFGKEDPRP